MDKEKKLITNLFLRLWRPASGNFCPRGRSIETGHGDEKQ